MRSPRSLGADRLFFERALELARRALGETAPNPPVGCVIVRDGVVLGEGYHAAAGMPHAEVAALRMAGDARGATAYVTLEPCNHYGRTPPCTDALIAAGIGRVVVGVRDPNGTIAGGGMERLRAAGVVVDLEDDPRCARLVEPFARWIGASPYLVLKMAMSLDGRIASVSGVRQWLTCDEERLYVRELRAVHDAVMVGAGTVRVDDPLLTVRPPRARRRPYVRIVACETDAVPASAHLFEPVEGYAPTIVLAPLGARERFSALEGVADVLYVGGAGDVRLDLRAAMRALREREIYSILCEGGPTLAARLLAERLVHRVYWAIAPTFLAADGAVPVLAGSDLATMGIRVRFDTIKRVGDDVVISGPIEDV
jgi:diaminohydroxyphosphoribosylaminopyrimidine deaminase/5-amino-6-(5-phosphoribosylamino)uracil reductase